MTILNQKEFLDSSVALYSLHWNSSILIGCVKSCDHFCLNSYMNKTGAGSGNLCPEVVVWLEAEDLNGRDVQVHQDVLEGRTVPWLC